MRVLEDLYDSERLWGRDSGSKHPKKIETYHANLSMTGQITIQVWEQNKGIFWRSRAQSLPPGLLFWQSNLSRYSSKTKIQERKRFGMQESIMNKENETLYG